MLLHQEPSKSEAQRDLNALQGTWKMVAFEINGESLPEDQVRTGRLTVSNDVYTATLGERTSGFKIELEPGTSPRAYNLWVREGAEKGKVFKGIYKLEGDTLTLCRCLTSDAERPTEFSTGAESGLSLVVWRRAQP